MFMLLGAAAAYIRYRPSQEGEPGYAMRAKTALWGTPIGLILVGFLAAVFSFW
jgi:hypothetical protein